MKWWTEPVAIAIAVIVVLVIVVIFVDIGLSVTQPHIPPTPTPEPVTEVTEIPTTLAPATETTTPTPEETTLPPTTPPPMAWAVAAKPIEDPNPYVLPYYSTVYNPAGKVFPVIFDQSYDFKYQYEAVVAHADKAPLIIDFAVSPGSTTPIRSFFLITVRDNTTRQLLAQDGYFRTYSDNSPKRLYFSSPGTYHINMYGAFVGVDLTIRAPPS